jgi:hypothetical protein
LRNYSQDYIDSRYFPTFHYYKYNFINIFQKRRNVIIHSDTQNIKELKNGENIILPKLDKLFLGLDYYQQQKETYYLYLQ